MTRIEIHKRLAMSIEEVDEIFGVFDEHRSLREMVEYAGKRYDNKSIVAGATLNMIITEVLADGDE